MPIPMGGAIAPADTLGYEEINYHSLPGHLRAGAENYINNGIIPGEFLQAVIKNDLFEAVGRADSVNKFVLLEICQFFINEAPASCHGSAKTMHDWALRGGLNGIRVLR